MATAKKRKTPREFGRLRTLPSGKHQASYLAPDGRVVNAPYTFQTLEQAKAWLTREQASIVTGVWSANKSEAESAAKEGKYHTLSEVAKMWRETRLNRSGEPLAPSTAKEYERLVDKVAAELARKPIRSISAVDVERWHAPLKRATPNQAAKAYGHLFTIMKYALRRKLISENPCDIENGARHDNKQSPIPTMLQVESMIENAPGDFKALLALAAWGGFRKGELLELRRSDISVVQVSDFEKVIDVSVTRAATYVDGAWIIKAPKTKSSIRHVLLPQRANDLLLAHLKTIPINPDAMLFPHKGEQGRHINAGDFHRIWDEVRRSVDFKGTFHALRAFHLTWFALTANPTAKELRDRGGHTTDAMANRYQRNTGRELELVRKLG